MNKQIFTLFLASLFMFCGEIAAQTGGNYAYAFLNLPPSSRITALGGTLITVRDDEPAQAVLNPALLNEQMHQSMTFQSNFHFEGIYNGYASYAQHFAESGITGHAGIQFMQYGKFTRADEFGNILGEFKASEFAFTLGAA